MVRTYAGISDNAAAEFSAVLKDHTGAELATAPYRYTPKTSSYVDVVWTVTVPPQSQQKDDTSAAQPRTLELVWTGSGAKLQAVAVSHAAIAAVTARYVRIGALKVAMQRDSNPVLNLAEVQAFSPSGTLLNPVSATLSSKLTGRDTASKCIDGSVVQTRDNTCHSHESDEDPFLVIDYGQPVAIESIRVRHHPSHTSMQPC